MDKEGFRAYLQNRNLSEQIIQRSFEIVDMFEQFSIARGGHAIPTPSVDDFKEFSTKMMHEGLNTYENYLALARYARFSKNRPVYLAAVELVDGGEVMDNLYIKVGSALGEAKRDEVFDGITFPPMGTPNSQKPIYMQAAIDRLLNRVDPETCKQILASGLRDLDDEYYQEDRKKYLEAGDIDAYLQKRGDDFIAQLEQIKNDHELFFNQEITDEVIEFVQSHPEIRQGVRQGNVIVEIKIPHMAKEYLAEQDETKKRYYYCHCPWVKESLKDGRSQIPRTFCNCSAAFVKKPWEVIFGQTLEAEIIESVLQGNLWCKIAVHLPIQV